MSNVNIVFLQRNVQKRHEKILKELEKRYDMERAKSAKFSENLKLKEEEATTLQKVSFILTKTF